MHCEAPLQYSAPGRFPLLVVAVLISLVACGAALAQEAAPTETSYVIDRIPYVIKRPGIYVVRNGLVIKTSTGTAITVEPDVADFTIDLGGHVISNSAPANGTNLSIGIEVSGSGMMVIRNGVLSGFGTGVSTVNAVAQTTTTIENVTCAGCGTLGIETSNGNDVTVSHCIVQDTGFNGNFEHIGIGVFGRNIQISDCRVVNTISTNNTNGGAFGIRLSAGSCGVVSNCFVAGDGGESSYGISISTQENAGNTMAVANTIFRCATGILFGDSGGDKYEGNLTQNCGTPYSGGISVGTNN